MKKIDFLQLDGQLLRTFLYVLEDSSVSIAAERLGVTQSTVSHALNRLRSIIGDPLFIRSGQGLTPTETALSLKAPILQVLDNLQGLTSLRPFNPKIEEMHFIVAANDIQRDLIFPQLLKDVEKDGIDLTLELRPSGVPSVGMLRDARCDLILTPLPPDAPDLIQKKLLTGDMKIFFDPTQRDAPKTLADYMSSDHIHVQFTMGRASRDILVAPDITAFPKPKVTVSNFAALPSFILGTSLIATQFEFMRHTTRDDLAMAPLPFKTEPASYFMVWHQRSTNDPAHKWLRDEVERIATSWKARAS